MKWQAERLRGNRWVVHPEGTLGTCGWIQGKPWSVVFVTARSATKALRKAGKEQA